MKRFAVLAVLPLLLNASIQWQVLKSDHFNLVYPKGYEEQARWAISWMETERSKPINTVSYDPGRTWVVIEDMGMTVNGFSNPVGNMIHLYTTPPAGFDLSTQDWMRTVGIHEYAHEVSLSSVWGFPRVLQVLLGPWVIPNMVTPGWMVEGITVFTESHVTPYEGRLEAGEYDANVLTRASQGVATKSWVMNGSLFEYPGGAIYAYGGPFYEWLVETKGVKAMNEFYRLHGSRIPLFSLDRSAKEAFGKRFPDLIKDWQASVQEKAGAFLPADSAARRLTDKGWYFNGGLAAEDEKIYFCQIYGKKPAALYEKFFVDIAALDTKTGKREIVARPRTTVNPPIRVHDGVLYYGASVESRVFPNTSGLGFGELVEIRALDLKRSRHACREKVLYEGRVRAFDRLPDGSFLVSVDRTPVFGSALLRIKEGVPKPEKIWAGDTIIGEILASNDGKVYFSARGQGENWDIFEYRTGDNSWLRLTQTPWAETGLNLNDNGSILYSANPYGSDGCAGAYKLDPQTKSCEQFKTPSFTLNPVTIGDELYFVGLNPSGYDIYSIKTSMTPSPPPSSPSSPPTDPQTRPVPQYDGGFERRSSLSPYLTLLRPWARVPYIAPQLADPYNGDFTLSHLEAGFFLMGADVLGENSYTITAGYDAVGLAPRTSIAWNNLTLAPLSLDLAFNLDPEWDQSGTLQGYYYNINPSFTLPLVVRSGKGLTSLTWGEGFRISGQSLEERVLSTSLGSNFAWPYVKLGLAARYGWESPIFSTGESSTLALRAVSAFDLAGGMLFCDVSSRIDLSIEKQPEYAYSSAIRGYFDTTITTSNMTFQTATLEYRHRLLKMRFGIWNPNVFFEDLYTNIFVDAAFDSRDLMAASAGIELSPEIHLIWNFMSLAPRIGVAITRDMKVKPVFGFDTSIPINIGKKTRDVREFLDKPSID